MNKKLQVFVSSTYTDLIEERQAAVQAILDAGHIPAGMELFKAGNKSQLQAIYKWIDESDVYMLILGGRYGTIEEESGLSYTELEYKYALSKDIPVFAVVLSESFLTNKITSLGLTNVMEQKAPDKYQAFKAFVMSKIIREVDDCKDIIIQVHATLNEFMREYNLTGWVRNSNGNDILQLSKDNNALNKEIASLNKQIQKLQEQLNTKSKGQFGNYSFDELIKLLKNKKFNIPLNLSMQVFKNPTIYAFDFFVEYYNKFVTGISDGPFESAETIHVFHNIAPYYISFELLEKTNNNLNQQIQTTKLGSAFYAMLESKGMTNIK